MVAFTLFGRPIYRYGIFYGVTFLAGYLFLAWVGKQPRLASYPKVQNLLTQQLDLFVLLIILGVIIGGRLGHVFLYERSYYQDHLGEIVQTRQGGMSFIGGLLGVTVVLLFLRRKYALRFADFLLLGDLILCVVPLGILLGRIGNFLNKELYGLVVYNKTLLSVITSDKARELKDNILFVNSTWYMWLYKLHLLADYGTAHTFPGELRLNTNFLQAFGEGLLLLVINNIILRTRYMTRRFRPGLISGVFLLGYGMVRFLVEYLKALPPAEMRGPLSVSQRVMLGFIAAGSRLLWRSGR